MDCSPLGSSVHRFLYARILLWVPISSSRGSSQPRNQTHISCVSCIGRQITSEPSFFAHNLTKCLGCQVIWKGCFRKMDPKVILKVGMEKGIVMEDRWLFSSFQFSSFTQSYVTLCDPMNCSMPGLPVHHQLPEFTQTHVH